jgi:hypothetical protein
VLVVTPSAESIVVRASGRDIIVREPQRANRPASTF